eukprot:5964131-Amphidinium_carterae.1
MKATTADCSSTATLPEQQMQEALEVLRSESTADKPLTLVKFSEALQKRLGWRGEGLDRGRGAPPRSMRASFTTPVQYVTLFVMSV